MSNELRPCAKDACVDHRSCGMIDERMFWSIVRRSLLNIVSAIDKRYGLGSYQKEVEIEKNGKNGR